MRTLLRLPEPEILTKNKEKWTEVYLNRRQIKTNSRPHTRQYGHVTIRDALIAMSFSKCFYCERRLPDSEGEVDHVIEVAERPDLAFVWTNLCWACQECNRKKQSNRLIPVTDCLDPCNPIDAPEDHLSFDDEYIVPRRGSLKGVRTIQKYRLDRESLNYLRVKQLRDFERLLRKIRERQLLEGRHGITEREKEFLRSFKQPNHPFSLMFEVYLAELGW